MTAPTDTQAPVHQHQVTITVNNKAVRIQGPRVTGLQIKQAAIAQGVEIELNFQLSEELGGDRTRIIGDNDEITVTEHSMFTAVADDDNS